MPDELPAHPNIDQLKKQAKELLRGLAGRDPSVVDRFRNIRRYASLSEEDLYSAPVTLRDAQYAVAIQYGFESWRRLSDHCNRIRKETTMNKTVTEQFNELKDLPDRAIQRILREIDTRELARALAGADGDTRERIFANMSSRAATIIEEEVRSLHELDENAVETAMSRLLSIYARLEKAGDVSKGGGDASPDRAQPITVSVGKAGEMSHEDFEKLFVEISSKSKTHGLLSIESDVEMITDPIIRKGLQLVVDGTDPDVVESILRNMLEKELKLLATRYEAAIEAVLSIQQGDSPHIVKERLESRLP